MCKKNRRIAQHTEINLVDLRLIRILSIIYYLETWISFFTIYYIRIIFYNSNKSLNKVVNLAAKI